MSFHLNACFWSLDELHVSNSHFILTPFWSSLHLVFPKGKYLTL